MSGNVLREGHGLCPVCIRPLRVRIVEDGGSVFQLKECPEHGRFRVLLSRDADYYREVSDHYFAVMAPRGRPGPARALNWYNLVVNLRCNLECPLTPVEGTGAGERPVVRRSPPCRWCPTDPDPPRREPTLEELEDAIGGRTGCKIGLWGGEATLRDDLPDIIRMVRRTGNVPALFTNGIRLQDPDYLGTLVDAGLDVVHLQFDGGGDRVDRALRGEPLAGARRAALDNLEAAGVPVILETSHVRGLNLRCVNDILREAVGRPNVRAVLFKAVSYRGEAALDEGLQVTPEDLMDEFIAGSGSRVDREDVLHFQRAFIAFSDVMRMPRCLFDHYYMVLRDPSGRDGYRTVSELVDLASLQPALVAYRRRRSRGSRLAAPLLALAALPRVLAPRAWPLVRTAASVAFGRLVLDERFTGSAMGGRPLLLGFGTVCDPFTYDADGCRYCTGGEFTVEDGTVHSVWALIFRRERDHARRADRAK